MSNENQIGAFMMQVRTAADRTFGQTPHELMLGGDYADVVYRLGQALPIDVMFDWFSSLPNSTGGRIKFPYQRIDSNLGFVFSNLDWLDHSKRNTKEKEQEYYTDATVTLAQTLSWIQIGWGGIDKFAVNADATVNWTTGIGHHASPEKRAQYIMTKGREHIEDAVNKYKIVRSLYDPMYGQDDVFRKYKIEYLLDRRDHVASQT